MPSSQNVQALKEAPVVLPPVFSMAFSHGGVLASVSATFEEQPFLLLPAPGEDSREQFCDACRVAIARSAESTSSQLLQLHAEFERAVNAALLDLHRQRILDSQKTPV